ncbi:hypothetical protein KKE92_00645 [Candidatus Micrarchaeota archaeon]|nr:hypothetical protein [Candidatus Micrarchaeota archaeon]MBU1682073.1 hypothetical protein [Candidatus Micrarchaeota archaeon]
MFNFVIAFVAGFIVKIVDFFEDDLKSNNPLKYGLAIIYGILIGYVIGNASFSVIFIAALIAQVLARKIDTTAHRVGFAVSIITALFFQVPAIDMYLLGYFMILAFLDEIEYIGKLKILSKYRPFLKIGVIPMIIIGRWDYAAGILIFDLGYETFNLIQYKIKHRR